MESSCEAENDVETDDVNATSLYTFEELRAELNKEKLKYELLNHTLQRLAKEKHSKIKQKFSEASREEHEEVECITSTGTSKVSVVVESYITVSSEKEHYCFYCFKRISKTARHLESYHRSEDEVAKILLSPKKSDERRRLFERIMCAGDFCHNVEVLRSGSGNLVVLRCPAETDCLTHDITASEYVPCPGCLGFIVKCDLWHHARKCRGVNEGICWERGSVLTASSLLMFPALSAASPEFTSRNYFFSEK